MTKVYADSPVSCPADGRLMHDLVYMGQRRLEGRKQRLYEYRCSACGHFIKKSDLQEATQDA